MSFNLFDGVRLTVPLVGFDDIVAPAGTRGAIVEIYSSGLAYEIDVSNESDGGTVTAEAGQIKPV
jgi:hypothetical protein